VRVTIAAHPCNLAEFSIYGGMKPDRASMRELVKGGSLRNDANTEKVGVPVEVESEGRESAVSFPFSRLATIRADFVRSSFRV
jgi:hypothetical protein